VKQKTIRLLKALVILAGIIFLAGVLRCWNLNQSFWWDEIWSTLPYATSASLWYAVSNIGYYFNNHLLYSLLARCSILLLGESELSARLPALLMGLTGIAAVFVVGRKSLGTGAGILGALLCAVSAFHIDHSTEARGYAGLALFCLLSSYYFFDGLRTNRINAWLQFSLFTVLGFYTHPFMLAVSLTQCFCAIVYFAAGAAGLQRIGITFAALRNMAVSLLSAALITLILYAPVLPRFLHNMEKVRIVEVTRWPFLASLLSSWCPGINSTGGALFYGTLLCTGIAVSWKRDPRMAVYSVVLTVMPLVLYLRLNPMFVFERYFIFALPFILLILGAAMAALAEHLSGVYRIGAVSLCLTILLYLQWPSLRTILTQDRQSYREAVQFVEHKSTGTDTDIVFSIGYAGEQFQYYARTRKVFFPESLEDLKKLAAGRKRIWCLMTAWLPAIRPDHEDRALYAERPGQMGIYDYVKAHFKLEKLFPSRYPVEIYSYEQ